MVVSCLRKSVEFYSLPTRRQRKNVAVFSEVETHFRQPKLQKPFILLKLEVTAVETLSVEIDLVRNVFQLARFPEIKLGSVCCVGES